MHPFLYTMFTHYYLNAEVEQCSLQKYDLNADAVATSRVENVFI